MPEYSRYSVVLELYDHTASHRSSSPLLPTTSTRLPPPLDHELRAVQDRLVLPSSSSNFWSIRLPVSRKLDTRTASTLEPAGQPLPAQSPSLESRPSPPPRIWSESFGLPSPPPIPTANLWTPSKGLSTATSSSPAQQAVLDWRFGPQAIDWIDHPAPRNVMPSAAVSPPAPLHPSASSSSPRPDRHAETSGTTDLYWGTIHLYKEQGAEESTKEEKRRAKDEDDGRAVGLVSVPGVLNAATLLAFIAPALESVEQVRMLRDQAPNRSLVLLRFRDAATASEFKRMYNGRPYHDSKDSEICHVVSLSSIKLKTTSTPPFTFPYSPSDLSTSDSGKDLIELPTCPVCLETLDPKVSGLVQIPCQHSYHCSCLLKWGDSRCPVCRATNARVRRNTITSETTDSKCSVCSSGSNLWICVLCGNVGCGRYQGGHAHSHFGETGHSYSLEIETSRVWSYSDDEYVHRLIRLRPNPSDPTSPSASRLIELPSISSSTRPAHSDPDDLSAKIGASVSSSGGPEDRSAEQDKLEALAVEYGNLMSAQLADQREYFEEEISRLKDLRRMGDAKREEAEREVEKSRKEAKEREKERREREAEWDKEKSKLEARIEQLEREAEHTRKEGKEREKEATRVRKALEKELDAERAVTTSLTENLASLRVEMGQQQGETNAVRAEVDELKETMNDLMAALSMRDKIEADPDSEMAGASIGVALAPQAEQGPRNPSAEKAKARRKKKK
ncbi:hypothetical protein JCM8547_006745 [Rhodosporidiobolus lusitaniae]